jgi:N-methylhydantoinase B
MAVNSRAQKHLEALCSKYSAAVVEEVFETAIENSESLMREEIARIPDGVYAFEDFLDDDGPR